MIEARTWTLNIRHTHSIALKKKISLKPRKPLMMTTTELFLEEKVLRLVQIYPHITGWWGWKYCVWVWIFSWSMNEEWVRGCINSWNLLSTTISVLVFVSYDFQQINNLKGKFWGESVRLFKSTKVSCRRIHRISPQPKPMKPLGYRLVYEVRLHH